MNHQQLSFQKQSILKTINNNVSFSPSNAINKDRQNLINSRFNHHVKSHDQFYNQYLAHISTAFITSFRSGTQVVAGPVKYGTGL